METDGSRLLTVDSNVTHGLRSIEINPSNPKTLQFSYPIQHLFVYLFVFCFCFILEALDRCAVMSVWFVTGFFPVTTLRVLASWS